MEIDDLDNLVFVLRNRSEVMPALHGHHWEGQSLTLRNLCMTLRGPKLDLKKPVLTLRNLCVVQLESLGRPILNMWRRAFEKHLNEGTGWKQFIMKTDWQTDRERSQKMYNLKRNYIMNAPWPCFFSFAGNNESIRDDKFWRYRV